LQKKGVYKPSYAAVQDGHEARHEARLKASVQALGRAAQELLLLEVPEQLTNMFW